MFTEYFISKAEFLLLPFGKAGRKFFHSRIQNSKYLINRWKFCIQRNNDNTKSTTSKIIAETKIIGSTKCIGKKWSLNQTWWSSYYKNLTIKMNLVTSRGHSYKNNELWNELKHQMRRGKAHNAVKIMVDNIKNDILLNEEMFQQLNRKHPSRRSPDPEVLIP